MRTAMRKSSSLTSRPRGSRCRGCPTRTGSTAFRVFTKHESRDTNHGFYAFHETRITKHGFVETGPFGTEGLQSFFWPGRRFMLEVMTPLSGTKTQSAPVGDALPGDTGAVRAAAGKVFHESRDTRHESRPFITRHGLCGRCVRRGCARDAPPGTAVRTTAPVAQSLLLCSRLFGIVQLKTLPLSQCRLSAHTGNTASMFFTETRNTVFPVPAATPRRATPSPTNGFSRDTRHETRITAFMFFTNHGLYCRRITSFCRVRTGFCRLITTFYRILTGQKPAIRRIPSDSVGMIRIPPEPRSAVRSEIPAKCAKSRIPQENARSAAFAAAPATLRAPWAAANAKGTHAEKGGRSYYRVDQSAYDRFFFYSGDRDEPRHVSAAWNDRVANSGWTW